MPRQGVPYPSREICSLKCQIDALQRQINELMKSINGVQGDGQGNVSLISGDPAIVINNDQAQNQIEIALDQSELPAAAVSSVNGQTGTVDLDGADIPLNPGQSTPTVQNAVAANAGNISQLQTDLNQEILDRGNADSVLQSNINAVSAGLPAAAAAAVAADPTVVQLAADVPNKLDKITSGSALKAYTHTGATQGEKSVVDGTTADSIAIRDADGRLQAADPASGATDKTLVTANWVSQTGDSGPNNLIHKSGNETKTGWLNMKSGIDGIRYQHAVNTDNTADDKWRLGFSFTMQTNEMLIVDIVSGFNNPDTQDATVKIIRSGANLIRCQVIRTAGTTPQMARADNYVVTLDGDTVSLYTFKRRKYTNLFALTVFYGEYGYVKQIPNITYSNTASNNPTTETHDAIAVGVLTAYHDQA